MGQTEENQERSERDGKLLLVCTSWMYGKGRQVRLKLLLAHLI